MVKITTVYESRDQKASKVSPILFNLKLIVTSIFCLVALTLYLISSINFPVLCLLRIDICDII